MGHKKFTKMAALYATDDLLGEKKTLFEKHLRGCGDCVKAVEEFRKLIGTMKQVSNNKKIDLWSAIRTSIYASPVRNKGLAILKPSFSIPALAAAVVMIIVIFFPREIKKSDNGSDKTYQSTTTIVRQSYLNGKPVVPHIIQMEDGTTIILFE